LWIFTGVASGDGFNLIELRKGFWWFKLPSGPVGWGDTIAVFSLKRGDDPRSGRCLSICRYFSERCETELLEQFEVKPILSLSFIWL